MTNCKTLLPQNNRTPLQLSLEQAQGCGINNMPVPLRDLWRVDSCPAELLPWLAWTLSVDVWDDSWNEEQKRNVIRASVEIHKHKGTLYAVEESIKALGIEASITEWWQNKEYIRRGRFHVEIKADEKGINTNSKQQILRRFIEHSKRLSALYDISIRDDILFNTTAYSPSLSRLTDKSIPILEIQSNCDNPITSKTAGHFKEKKSYQQFSFNPYKILLLETTNKHFYKKPDLALRIVSKDADIITVDRIEASASLQLPHLFLLNSQIREEKNIEQFKNTNPLLIAFESNNRKTARKPDLSLRVVTRDIAIATDTYREQKAILVSGQNWQGFTAIAKKNIDVLNFNAPANTMFAFESNNQKVKQRAHLAVRLVTKDIPIETTTTTEAKADLLLTTATIALSRVQNLNIKPAMTANADLNPISTSDLSGHYQQTAIYNAMQSDCSAKIALLSRNFREKQFDNNLGLRIVSKNEAINTADKKEIKSELKNTTYLISRSSVTQKTNHAVTVVKQQIIQTLAFASCLKQNIIQATEKIIIKPRVKIVSALSVKDKNSFLMRKKATNVIKNSTAILNLIRQREITPLNRTPISLFNLVTIKQPDEQETFTFEQISTVATIFIAQVFSKHKTMQSHNINRVTNSMELYGLVRQLI